MSSNIPADPLDLEYDWVYKDDAALPISWYASVKKTLPITYEVYLDAITLLAAIAAKHQLFLIGTIAGLAVTEAKNCCPALCDKIVELNPLKKPLDQKLVRVAVAILMLSVSSPSALMFLLGAELTASLKKHSLHIESKFESIKTVSLEDDIELVQL